MNFMEIAQARQSCRSYDTTRAVEQEKLDAMLAAARLAPVLQAEGARRADAMLAAARLAPSACNGQPYHFTVCRGDVAKQVELAARGMAGLNRFATDAPVVIVVSEKPYVKTAALGAKVKNNDYRSIDIGIAVAYLTAEAAAQGLGTCILGWLDDAKIRAICDLDQPVRLLVTVGYPKADDPLRKKVRKDMADLVKER